MYNHDHCLTVPRAFYNTQELVRNNPLPELHPRKAYLYNLACPEGSTHAGKITVTQYKSISSWETRSDEKDHETVFELGEPMFSYKQQEGDEWWVNFAGRMLFIAYSGELFAQDEIQVAEHPALAHLRECLSKQYASHPPDKPNPTQTRFNGSACPVLIRGVERRCAIKLDNLYGSRFAHSSEDDIWMATDVLPEPCPQTNLICMTALCGGTGNYDWQQLKDLYFTAFTAFRGAKNESPTPNNIVIHTGHWGCGAFGGNRIIMVLIQQLAALDARITKLVYHAYNDEGTRAYSLANEKRLEWEKEYPDESTQERLERILFEGHEWGIMDQQ